MAKLPYKIGLYRVFWGGKKRDFELARAKRHYIPGQIWHITHRCHKREFLLRFAKDRYRYLKWLYQARKQYGLSILNYMVTSNHVHLLIVDKGAREVIPRAMQLVAGRTGQESNQRKHRKGAFWEGRYHATVVESGDHLVRCLVYIDTNRLFLRSKTAIKALTIPISGILMPGPSIS